MADFKGIKKEHFERLLNLREELIAEVEDLSEASLSLEHDAGAESADVASENFIRDMGLGILSEEGKRVELINKAIIRLEEGTFGVCFDCNKPIPEGRLEAIPYALLCVNCKSKREEREEQGYTDDEEDFD